MSLEAPDISYWLIFYLQRKRKKIIWNGDKEEANDTERRKSGGK